MFRAPSCIALHVVQTSLFRLFHNQIAKPHPCQCSFQKMKLSVQLKPQSIKTVQIVYGISVHRMKECPTSFFLFWYIKKRNHGNKILQKEMASWKKNGISQFA